MKLLDRYEEIVGHQEVERLRRLAERLAGKRIVHVNSTRTGGGVAEILGWMIPLMQELGIDARWEVITGPPDFYRVTKAFHNGLQGLPVSLQKKRFRSALRGQSGERPAAESGGRRRVRARSAADLPAAVHAAGPGGPMDLAMPHRRLAPEPRRLEVPGDGDFALRGGGLFHGRLYAAAWPARCSSSRLRSIRFPTRTARFPRRNGWRRWRGWRSIPSGRCCCRSRGSIGSRIRLGVIEAYRLLKPYYPELQLALAGGPADDDPEGAEVLREVMDRAGDDENLKVLMLPPDAHRTINALQRSATVVLQKSFKEGFGLTVTEALWKGKPVIGGACGGITLQVHDYQTGFLVHSPAGAAYRIRYLLRYADKRQRMGRTGHDFVREHFLLTRNLRDYLTMLLCLDHPESGVIVV